MIMAYHLPNTNTYAAPAFASLSSCNEASVEGFDEFFEFDDWFDSDIPTFPSLDDLHWASCTGGNVCAGSGRVTEAIIDSKQNHDITSGRLHFECSFKDYKENRIEKKERSEKVAFRTKSEIEVLDDGFKWRKYGKKKVKNSPNPRNYYKCAVESCTVKKRVERDNEDRRYIITTYEGIHNHRSSTI